MGRRHAPRVLLADEVGLGKNREAGMILHQQLSGAAEPRIDHRSRKPATPVAGKCCAVSSLRFALFDERTLCQRSTTHYNPFETEQLVDLLAGSPAVISSVWNICATPVGSAGGRRSASSGGGMMRRAVKYMAIEQLAERGVLLTATPGTAGDGKPFQPVCACWIEPFHDFERLSKNRKTLPPCRRCGGHAAGGQ